MGPSTEDDLRCIASVTGDEELVRSHDAVWESLHKIWSAHLSAGMRLREELKKRLPEKLSELRETATAVDLDELGTAWVVMVEEIAPEPEPRARYEINWLHFPDNEDDEPQLL